MSLPWSKFFWSDYAADPALKICSFAAQGLWMRMLCIAAEHDPVGYVAVNGNGLDQRGIARMTGGMLDEVSELLDELETHGVFTRDRRGWIYSRRMINDAKKRRVAVETGKLGAKIKREKQKEISPTLEGGDKGGVEGGHKTHMPEARVQREKTDIKKRLPEDWIPEGFNEGSKCAAITAFWTQEETQGHIEAFTAHHQREGSKFVDWQAAWRTWVLNSAKFAKDRIDRRQADPASGYLKHVVEHVIPELEKEDEE